MTHEQWWNDVGSGIHPLPGEDRSEHMQRVIAACWPEARAAVYAAEAHQITSALRDEIRGLRAAANALLHQIDIGDFVDSHGHSAKMLKATHDLMAVLTPNAGVTGAEPQAKRPR